MFLGPVHAWFLKINPVCKVCVCVSVYPPPRLVITSGLIWTLYDWLNKFYSFCIVAIVGIISRRDLIIEAHCRNLLNKSKLALYKLLLHFYSHLKQLYISNKMEHFSYKCRCGIHRCTHIETFTRRAGLGYR